MAKTTLYLEFTGDISLGTSVNVAIVMGSAGTTNAILRATTQRTKKGDFVINDPSVNPSEHPSAFVFTWNKDYKDVGGFNNMLASITDINGNPSVKIEIADLNWTIDSVTVNDLTPDEIIATFDNSAGDTPKSFTHSLDSADCTDATYDITIQGGVSPYVISGLPGGDLTGVTSPSTFVLKRSTPAAVKVTDSEGTLIQTKYINPPKKLRSADFDISVVPENGWNTANVAPNVVLEAVLLPITYSLDNVTFAETASFPGLGFEENYTLYIKDAFGCVVSKNFVTLEDLGTELEQQYYRNAYISNAGTLIFAERQELSATVRKNPRNSLSCGEMNAIPYAYVQKFLETDTITQQFKSSYNYHKITLLTNGTAKYIEPIRESENLNQIEKVDAKLFKTIKGYMGMYFDGGNTYVPDTSTVDSTSYYGTNTLGEDDFPSWGTVGQIVEIDGVGFKTIKRITTDPQRGLYLEFGDFYTSLVDVEVKVQAQFNRQDYNTYEFEVDMADVEGEGRVFIEMGFNGLVERVFVSEHIKKVDDDYGMSLITWKDPLNKAGIVHQTGIQHFARMFIKLDHYPISESELYDGDSAVYSLDQTVGVGADFQTVVYGFKMAHKLAMASGMEDFYINNVEYKKDAMEKPELLGDSNMRLVNMTLRMSGNELNVNTDEIVLNPSSTPLTAKPGPGALALDYLAIDDDSFILNGEGGLVRVNV